MKELSLHVLDITQNSITAQATQIEITLEETEDGQQRMVIQDNGCGMSQELLDRVTDPFATTRTTRKVGMGLALLGMFCQQTGGTLDVRSQEGVGTTVDALFLGNHIDCAPVGDMGSTISTLIHSAPTIGLIYTRRTPTGSFTLDTRELQAELGEDISLAEPEIIAWIRDYVREQEKELGGALS